MTCKIEQSIKDGGHKLVTMWECQWKEFKKQNRIGSHHKYLYSTESKYRMTQSEIVECVKTGAIFGAVEVDINVPEELKGKFSEMTPIFKNTTVTENDIGEHMCAFLRERNEKFKPTRYLIGSMFAEKFF